eukprot:m51a1_g3506 hypothetical protein (1589) ;mRNA; r:856079-863275
MSNENHLTPLEAAWMLRTLILPTIPRSDLVSLALAFPAALAVPCIRQLHSSFPWSAPPETADAVACDALVSAVADGRIGDARALLRKPFGESVLRWELAGRAAELVSFAVHQLGRHHGREEEAQEIVEQFVATVVSTRKYTHMDPLQRTTRQFQGVAPVVSLKTRLKGLEGLVAFCPNCRGRVRLELVREADLHLKNQQYSRGWSCDMCKAQFCKPDSKSQSLTLFCKCTYNVCGRCALGVLGATSEDPLEPVENGGLDGLKNSRGRSVFYGANNRLGGIYCGGVLDDKARSVDWGGFLCGLESGNECTSCHELHRKLLADCKIACPLCCSTMEVTSENDLLLLTYKNYPDSHPYRRRWTCRMCENQFKMPETRSRALMMHCHCGYDLCSRCCLGVIGAGHDKANAPAGRSDVADVSDVVESMLQPPLAPAELLHARVFNILLWSLKFTEDVGRLVTVLMAPPVGLTADHDLVSLALAFPAALAVPCIRQLRSSLPWSAPPETADAVACDALVSAVADGRIGDARALLRKPFGESVLRWESAGRAAELVSFAVHQLGRHHGREEEAQEIVEQFVATVVSTRKYTHMDPLQKTTRQFQGVAPVVSQETRLKGLDGRQCDACHALHIKLLEGLVVFCPNCPRRARLEVVSEADLCHKNSHGYEWSCDMCKALFRSRDHRPGFLTMLCGCTYTVCSSCALGVLGATSVDPMEPVENGCCVAKSPEQGFHFAGRVPLVCSRQRLNGLDALTNSRGRSVFYGANNRLGGIYCGGVLDDKARSVDWGGFLCGLESGNECTSCHELHRKLLADSKIVCPLCHAALYVTSEVDLLLLTANYDPDWHPYQCGWSCDLCGNRFKMPETRSRVLMMHCHCGYDLCSRCCLGVIGAGYSKVDNPEGCYSELQYWTLAIRRDDWATRLLMKLPNRLFFVAGTMGMTETTRLLAQKPLDLVSLALAFPAALAAPCIRQLRRSLPWSAPPETADAVACDALVSAVADGRIGDARALLRKPFGGSVLRWESAGRAAELVSYAVHQLGRHTGREDEAQEIVEQFVATVVSTRTYSHVDPLRNTSNVLYQGTAPVVAEETRLKGLGESGRQCDACHELHRKLLEGLVARCPECPEHRALRVISEAELPGRDPAYSDEWNCDMCGTLFYSPETRTRSLMMTCSCGCYDLCCWCALGVLGAAPLDPLKPVVYGSCDMVGASSSQKEEQELLFHGVAPPVASHRLSGLDGLKNSRGRSVFYGANNRLGGIYCGGVLDDKASSVDWGGFLCGLESGNECTSCRELHRKLLVDSAVVCPRCSERLAVVSETDLLQLPNYSTDGWACNMCGNEFRRLERRSRVLMMRCHCGYDLCSRCCLGVIGAGYSRVISAPQCFCESEYWEIAVSREDWATRLLQKFPVRLLFVAGAMGLTETARLLAREPMSLDRASTLAGEGTKFYDDPLLFALYRRASWITSCQESGARALNRCDIPDVVESLLQPPLAPAELARSRIFSVLLLGLMFAEGDGKRVVDILMAQPIGLTAGQCLRSRAVVEAVSRDRKVMDVLASSHLRICKKEMAAACTLSSFEYNVGAEVVGFDEMVGFVEKNFD